PFAYRSETTLRRVHTLVPSHSISSGRPTARRKYVFRSTLSGSRILPASSTISRQMAFIGSITRTFDHTPPRSTVTKNVVGLRPHISRRLGARKYKWTGYPRVLPPSSMSSERRTTLFAPSHPTR